MNAEELRRLWMLEAGMSENDITTSIRDDPPFSVERESKQLQLIRRHNMCCPEGPPGEQGPPGIP